MKRRPTWAAKAKINMYRAARRMRDDSAAQRQFESRAAQQEDPIEENFPPRGTSAPQRAHPIQRAIQRSADAVSNVMAAVESVSNADPIAAVNHASNAYNSAAEAYTASSEVASSIVRAAESAYNYVAESRVYSSFAEYYEDQGIHSRGVGISGSWDANPVNLSSEVATPFSDDMPTAAASPYDPTRGRRMTFLNTNDTLQPRRYRRVRLDFRGPVFEYPDADGPASTGVEGGFNNQSNDYLWCYTTAP